MTKLALVALLALASCGSPAYADDAPAQPDATGVSPVVKLLLNDAANDQFYCSGFYVGDGTIISAGHCLADAHGTPLKVVLQDGEVISVATVEYGDPANGAHDYSILHMGGLQPINWKPADLDCSGVLPKIGTDVRDEGFPDSEEAFTVSWGKVNGYPHPITDAWAFPVVPVQVPNDGGNSGGPSFLGDTNTVWGIVVGKNPSQPAFGMVQPIQPVCEALELSSSSPVHL